ncbi:ABC transporter ATP-binding protein [Phytohabitans aurantiacus]|uniref:ABC transporter ATP-binding protein n=1 Tax=Phytohabitans aurantiacus TaxID=3016789 RepID=A0ABQ5QYL4_9ACTN|nr:ABC transporter ATP-binding protein [Phytohabitans aurantiacus]GLH99365.1 ABC transporter ATP-binding protein [Phytohabitans aurantiacus]
MTDHSPGGGVLAIDGLRREFGAFVALRKLDLRVSAGEFVALLGPSGCGKTTALNLVAGLIEPTAGTITLDGHRIERLPSEKRGIGMVFQNYALFPHMSVADNLGFGLRMRRRPKHERVERVSRALALVRLTEHAHKYPGQLSGGQQQRVAIARAVVVEPRLVLMDEPLSNLDAKLRLDMRTEIRLLHQQLGLTTIYVTHDQTEALSLADRLVVLKDGAVQQIGTPSDVYEQPANAFVAAFMGYRNVLEGDLRAGDLHTGSLALRTRPGTTGKSGRAVALIRPDDLRLLPDDAAPAPNAIPVRVRVCEYLGREFAIEAVGPGEQVLHGRAARPLTPGERAVASVDPERVLVFPATEGAAVSAPELELVAQGEQG